jgi:hypothetical protein
MCRISAKKLSIHNTQNKRFEKEVIISIFFWFLMYYVVFLILNVLKLKNYYKLL